MTNRLPDSPEDLALRGACLSPGDLAALVHYWRRDRWRVQLLEVVLFVSWGLLVTLLLVSGALR